MNTKDNDQEPSLEPSLGMDARQIPVRRGSAGRS